MAARSGTAQCPQAYRLMGQYDLGPGISLTGAIGYDQFDDGAANKEYDTTMVGAGLLLSF